jgi:hypothetical protein
MSDMVTKEPIILTQDLLKTHFSYDPDSGIFTHLTQKRGHGKIGKKAGRWNENSGNFYIRFFNVTYIASHIAFLYMENRLPSRVTYLDGDRQKSQI